MSAAVEAAGRKDHQVHARFDATSITSRFAFWIGRNNKLELVISVGLPPEAQEVELYAQTEGNGISGYTAATGRSYICPDVERPIELAISRQLSRS